MGVGPCRLFALIKQQKRCGQPASGRRCNFGKICIWNGMQFTCYRVNVIFRVLWSIAERALLVCKNINMGIISAFMRLTHSLTHIHCWRLVAPGYDRVMSSWLLGDNHFITSLRATGKRKPRTGCVSQQQNRLLLWGVMYVDLSQRLPQTVQ